VVHWALSAVQGPSQLTQQLRDNFLYVSLQICQSSWNFVL
jgi:hypothetical protein